MTVALYPHQVSSVARHIALLKSRGVTSDRSETGTGKTVSILQAAKELRVPIRDYLPKDADLSLAPLVPADGIYAHYDRGLGKLANLGKAQGSSIPKA